MKRSAAPAASLLEFLRCLGRHRGIAGLGQGRGWVFPEDATISDLDVDGLDNAATLKAAAKQFGIRASRRDRLSEVAARLMERGR